MFIGTIISYILIFIVRIEAEKLSCTSSGSRYSGMERFCGEDRRDTDALIQSLLEMGIDRAITASGRGFGGGGGSSQPAPQPAAITASPAPATTSETTTPPTTTTTTIPPGRRRYYTNSIPACEDDDFPDTLDSVCIPEQWLLSIYLGLLKQAILNDIKHDD